MRRTERRAQVAAITGAASGLGRALCEALAREGTRLLMIDRDATRLEEAAEWLRAGNAAIATAALDVRDRAALRRAVERHAAELGPVDLLIACAGVTGVTLVDELDVDGLEAIVRINYLGAVYAIDAVLPEMLARRSGQIVAVSSLAGWRGMPFSAAYSASKAALMRYVESIRPSLRRHGIAVCTVCPGFVRTPLMENAPLRPPLRMLEPDEAARCVLHAIRRRRREYSFPLGIGLCVRMLTWLPAAWYDWMMARAARNIPNLKY